MNENKGTNIDIYCLINILGLVFKKTSIAFHRVTTMKS